MRSQEDKDFLLSNLSEPRYIENFITQEVIEELIYVWKNSNNKRTKNKEGPICSDIIDFTPSPLSKIRDRIYFDENLFPNSKIYHGMFFYTKTPHIIHNDDVVVEVPKGSIFQSKMPLMYKGFNIPIEYEGEQNPHLLFFDQFYIEGHGKFFNNEKDIIKINNRHGREKYKNVPIFEYSEVLGTSTEPFDCEIKEKYLSHIKDEWLEGLSFNSIHEWIPGNITIFDCYRLHCASNFRKLNIKSKLGISIFTEHK